MRLLPDDPAVGRTPLLWLLYLAFVFIGPVFAGTTARPWTWTASWVSVVLFGPLYFLGYWTEGWRQVGVGVLICLIGTALSPINTGGNTYFIFGAYFCGYSVTAARQIPLRLLPWAAVVAVTSVLVQPSAYFWAPAVLGGLVIGLLGSDQRRRAMHTVHLSMARAEVEALARIAERERIAADLHDLLGQSLSLVSLKAELAQRLLPNDQARAAKELGEIRDVARQALSEVRTAVQGYRVGNGAGLRQELANARRALDAAGVQLQCDDDLTPLVKRLDAKHEAVVALALREGVTNVVRHAAAQHCEIRFLVDDEGFGVEIADDGQGLLRSVGNGLTGMRQRVESLGGRLELDAANGTTVRLRFRTPPPEAA